MPNGDAVVNAQGTALGSHAWWPNQQATLQYPYHPSVWYAPTSTDDYANEVEVSENEHDAVLTFYRRQGRTRSQVKAITVPKALLAKLAPKGDA